MIELSPKEIATTAINTFKAQQKPEELTALLEKLLILKPKVILEIGFGSGGTLWAFSHLQSVENIISVDIEAKPCPWVVGDFNCEVQCVIGNSMNGLVLEAVRQYLRGTKVDFLHIDGCHDYACVKSDYELYSLLVREGGLIALHDVVAHAPETKCEVNRFVHELINANVLNKKMETIIHEPTNWGGYGLIYK